MKRYFILTLVLSFCIQFTQAQIEIVKRRSELQWISDSICYDNGNEFTGEVIDYRGQKFDKTKLLYDGHFLNGQRNGTVKQWYPDFRIESIENYKRGLREGQQTTFYSNGNKKTEGSCIHGLRSGIWVEWYENKQQKSSYVYESDNIVDGTYVTYLDNGQKDREILLSGGQKISESIYANGVITESWVLKSEYDQQTKENYKGYLKNSKKEGLWTYWYDGVKKKREGYYKDDLETGKWTFWFENGTVEYVGTCKNGLKEGLGMLHYKGGELTYTGEFKNNLRDGYGSLTWKDGSLNYQGSFKNNWPDGKGISYDKGKVVYDGEWKNGKKNGEGTYNDSESGFVCTGEWVDGKLEGQGSMKRTDEEGNKFTLSGEFKDFKLFNGTLTMVKLDGRIFSSEYVNGKKGKLRKIN